MTLIAVKRVRFLSYLSPILQGLKQPRTGPIFLFILIGFVLFSFSYLIATHQVNDPFIRLHQMMLDDNSVQETSALLLDVASTTQHSAANDAAGYVVSIQKKASPASSSLFKSSCSRSADLRGPHQKIIGYTIYGDFSQKTNFDRYVEPLRETIKAIPSLYPGWIVRIHHNLKKEEHGNSSWKILEKAVDFASHVDLCNVTEISKRHKISGTLFAMTWRWLPTLDELVDTFMSRDADSMILAREQDAVAEWMDSDRIFHVMRDHPAHCIFMLGGMWGVKLDKKRRQITKAFESMFKIEKHRNQYGFDQKLLTKCIWPIAKSNHLAHDSYCCQKFIGSKPFPSQRTSQMHFVGRVHQKGQLIKSPCPEQCRPLNVYPEWIYC